MSADNTTNTALAQEQAKNQGPGRGKRVNRREKTTRHQEYLPAAVVAPKAPQAARTEFRPTSHFPAVPGTSYPYLGPPQSYYGVPPAFPQPNRAPASQPYAGWPQSTSGGLYHAYTPQPVYFSQQQQHSYPARQANPSPHGFIACNHPAYVHPYPAPPPAVEPKQAREPSPKEDFERRKREHGAGSLYDGMEWDDERKFAVRTKLRHTRFPWEN